MTRIQSKINRPETLLQLVLFAAAIAWLAPGAVLFLPWSVVSGVVDHFGIGGLTEPMQKYWLVMAGAISGFAGAAMMMLAFKPERKLGHVASVGGFHLGVGVVLLVRGRFFDAPIEIVLWDSVFCVLTGALLLAGCGLVKRQRRRITIEEADSHGEN